MVDPSPSRGWSGCSCIKGAVTRVAWCGPSNGTLPAKHECTFVQTLSMHARLTQARRPWARNLLLPAPSCNVPRRALVILLLAYPYWYPYCVRAPSARTSAACSVATVPSTRTRTYATRSTASQFLSWHGTPASRCHAAGSEKHDVLRLKLEQRATATPKPRNPVPPWRPTTACKSVPFKGTYRASCFRTPFVCVRIYVENAAKILLPASITSRMGAPPFRDMAWH